MWIWLKIKKTDYHAFVIPAQKTAKNVQLHFQAVEKDNKVENRSDNFQRKSLNQKFPPLKLFYH